MNRRDYQYPFVIHYDKTFTSGLLNGITIQVQYGTCDTRPFPKNRLIGKDYMTNDDYVISNIHYTQNY